MEKLFIIDRLDEMVMKSCIQGRLLVSFLAIAGYRNQ
jgi:hypothetical protein